MAQELTKLSPDEFRIGSIKFSASPLCVKRPALQLSGAYTAGTPEGIAAMNAWLLKVFGYKEAAYRIGDTYYVSPATYARLRQVTQPTHSVQNVFSDIGVIS